MGRRGGEEMGDGEEERRGDGEEGRRGDGEEERRGDEEEGRWGDGGMGRRGGDKDGPRGRPAASSELIVMTTSPDKDRPTVAVTVVPGYGEAARTTFGRLLGDRERERELN
ncbi:hypothetical protein NHX12_014728 [Muraenolepis orangiensis]|uniref:Uncharacterized protein n=1 Tax=Muraenolepis orangiensis TaxID=630683 RepID=A0A9Q0I2C8_9TELE|nr:hypothetical protein NHX12_014728 [Muraenolepis orangiensis]